MHPLIRRYLTDPREPAAIFRDFASSNDPAASLVGRILLGLNAEKNSHAQVEGFVRECSGLPLNGMDRELAVLFLFCWIQCSRGLGDMAQVSFLQGRLAALNLRGAPPEIRAAARRAGTLGKGSAVELATLRDILRSFPRRSPRRLTLVLQYLYDLARQGLLAEGADELAWVKAQSASPFIRETLARARAVNLLLTRADPAAMEGLTWKPGDHGVVLARILDGQVSDTPLPWSRCLAALRAGRMAESLHEARLHEDSVLDTLVPFLAALHILPRAALAAGQAVVCRGLLAERTRRGRGHWLDDLYLCQAAFMEGRTQEAREAFQRMSQAAGVHEAWGRVDVELAMSPLSRADLARLAAGIPGHTPVATKASGPREPSRPERMGPSRAMREFTRQLEHAAPHTLTVLLEGQTGSGRSHSAHVMHTRSPRRQEPLVTVDCGALPENLALSELFGHVRGAFTGAETAREGAFRQAGRGTLLLEGIDDLAPSVQGALLRALETGEIRPLGSTRTQHIACRVVATSLPGLRERALAGHFRPDLYYRLAGLVIDIPSLAARSEDIPHLARYFLSVRTGSPASMSLELSRRLRRAPWPGNLRELRGEMEHMVLMAGAKERYDLADLPPRLAQRLKVPSGPAASPLEAHPPGMPDFIHPAEDRPRRHQRILDLLREHTRLRRADLVRAFGLHPITLSRDLTELVRQGRVQKVRPSPAPRTHYFTLA